MNNELSKNSKSYRTAAILFSISGLTFIKVSIVSGHIGILPIGIALVMIGIVAWERNKKLTDGGC